MEWWERGAAGALLILEEVDYGKTARMALACQGQFCSRLTANKLHIFNADHDQLSFQGLVELPRPALASLPSSPHPAEALAH